MTTTPPLTFNAWLRFDLIAAALGRGPDARDVLELGCGQGAMGSWLARRGDYVGVEPDAPSAAVARRRLAQVGRGSVVSSLDEVADDRRFDVVCAFEVLEHIEDDAAALRTWRDRLRPGGLLVLSVPAFQARFGPSDERVGHFRRYEPDDLASLLAATGFVDPDVAVYGFPLGLLLDFGRNALARRGRWGDVDMAERTAASGRLFQPDGATAVLTRTVTSPFRWLQRARPTRRGSGLVASARRPTA